jgi:hypothetical protein
VRRRSAPRTAITGGSLDKDKSSKYIGVSWKERTKKWAAIICYERQNIIVGYFKDEIHAAKAYDKAAKKYHAEFASLNFPD